MTTDDNKQLVRRYYEEVVSTGDVARLAEFISSDYVEVHNSVRHEIGLAGARDHVLGVRNTYPDLQMEIERQIAEADWVVTIANVRGTHRGVWLGMKPTNKTLQMSVVNLDRVSNGKIVEHGGAANLLQPLLEIGAIRISDPVDDA